MDQNLKKLSGLVPTRKEKTEEEKKIWKPRVSTGIDMDDSGGAKAGGTFDPR
jgi:hypothetical protein